MIRSKTTKDTYLQSKKCDSKFHLGFELTMSVILPTFLPTISLRRAS